MPELKEITGQQNKYIEQILCIKAAHRRKRRASLSERLHRLFSRVHTSQGEADREAPNHPEYYKSRFADAIEKGGIAFGCFHSKCPDGICAVYPIPEKETVVIGAILTEENDKSSDVRKILIRSCVQYAREEGMKWLILAPPEENFFWRCCISRLPEGRLRNFLERLYAVSLPPKKLRLLDMCRFYGRYAENKENSWLSVGFANLAAMLLILGILFVGITGFGNPGNVRSYPVTGKSMEPTLKEGVKILTNNVKEPQRGDIVVFSYPLQKYSPESLNGAILVKRVIGLPGETVDMHSDNTIWINGVTLDEPYLQPGADASNYRTMQNHHFVLGDNEYFLCGDNRGNSFDSRFFGPIPETSIVGVVNTAELQRRGTVRFYVIVALCIAVGWLYLWVLSWILIPEPLTIRRISAGAKIIPEGYDPEPIDLTTISLSREQEELVNEVASRIHDEWVARKRRMGYSYGESRERDDKEDPDILPYEQLSDRKENSRKRIWHDQAEKYVKLIAFLNRKHGE